MSSPFCFFYIAVALPVPFFFLARSRRGHPWMAFWLPVACMAALVGGVALLPRFPHASWEAGVALELIGYGLGQQRWLYALVLCTLLALGGCLLCRRRAGRPVRRGMGLGLLGLLLLFHALDAAFQLLPRLCFTPLSPSAAAQAVVETETTAYYRQQIGLGTLALQPAEPSAAPFVTRRDIPVYADTTRQAAQIAQIPAGAVYADGLALAEAGGLPTVRRGWRYVVLDTAPRQRGYVRTSDLLAAFDAPFLERVYIRQALLTQDLNHALAGCFLSPDYNRAFLPWELLVLLPALAALLGAQVAALLRRRHVHPTGGELP